MWNPFRKCKPPSPLDQAVKLFPHDPEGMLRACEVALRSNPGDAAAHAWMGTALKLLKQIGRATAAYEEALRLDPDNTLALMDLGIIRGHQGDIAAARGYFERWIATDSTNSTAWNIYISVLSEQEQFDEAVSVAHRALAANPHNMILLLALGKVYQKKGDHTGANRAYRAATRADHPSLPETRGWLGRKIGYWLVDLPHRRSMEPTHLSLRGQAHAKLGDLYAEMGQPEEARREWQSALGLYKDAQAMDPTNAQMRDKGIERVRKKLEELGEAKSKKPYFTK